jgi:hypothetical protein
MDATSREYPTIRANVQMAPLPGAAPAILSRREKV